VALEEVSVAGTVTGSNLNTRASDGVPESIEESPGSLAGTRVHTLEHKWIVDVKAGHTIIFSSGPITPRPWRETISPSPGPPMTSPTKAS
jgi:hypothetical protein